MKRNALATLLSILCASVLCFSAAGCGGRPGRTSLSLDDGWQVRADPAGEGERLGWNEGFQTDSDAASLSADADGADTLWYSNAFTSDLSVSKKDRVVLRFNDAAADMKVWLNGKEAGVRTGAGSLALDVTGLIEARGANQLVVRAEADTDATAAIGTGVNVTVHPQVMVTDAYAHADYATGDMTISVTLDNGAAETKTVSLNAVVSAHDTDSVMTRQVLDVTAAPGVSTHEIEVSIPDFIAWSNANPYLYKVNVRAKAQDADRADTADFYTGFQRVAIDGGGYFTLNGRRILLKCANITVQQSYGDKLFEILNYIKTCGFNAVRTADGPASAAMLDYCDKLGLLVCETGYADQAATTEQYAALARRDRGHASLAMTALFPDFTDTAGRAASLLAAFRQQDPDTLVLSAGGASNPGTAAFHSAFTAVSVSGLDEITALTAGDNTARFVYSCGVSGMTDPVFDAQAIDEWYEDDGIDALLSDAQIADRISAVHVNEDALLLDYARANERINGICLTADFSAYKTALTDAAHDAFNDLRWCILTDRTEAYDTDTLSLNVSLSNIGVLTEGTYTARIKISGEGGVKYSNDVSFAIAADADGYDMQIPVLQTSISLANFPAGRYRITAELIDGGHPTCGEKALFVASRGALPQTGAAVYCAGVAESVQSLLQTQGAQVSAYAGGDVPAGAVILLGSGCSDSALLTAAYQRAQAGAHLILLDAAGFDSLPVQGEMQSYYAALIHKNGLTGGLARTGCFHDGSMGRDLAGGETFVSTLTFEPAVSSVAAADDGGVTTGVLCGTAQSGSGFVTVNTLRLEAASGSPAADGLLLNLVNSHLSQATLEE